MASPANPKQDFFKTKKQQQPQKNSQKQFNAGVI